MLERASSSVECTAQILLRNIERPARSHRVLGSTFWRNAGDHLEVPVWWPAYLQNVRDKANGHRSSRDGSATLASTACGSHSLQNSQHTRKFGRLSGIEHQTKGRSFAYITSSNQSAFPAAKTEESSRIHDEFGFLDADKDEGIHEGNATQVQGVADEDRNNVKANGDKQNFVTNGVKNNYQDVWALFVQSGHRQDIAPKMLHFLAGSTSKSDLRHALTVFHFIPTKRRTESDYEAALDVAIKCQDFKAAVHIVLEAISKGQGKNGYFKLMAHCVQQKLWNTLAGMWQSVGTVSKPLTEPEPEPEHVNRKPQSPNVAGKYAFHFEMIEKFPEKIISLAERLSQSDAILAAKRTILIEICKRLAYIAAESPSVMATISGEQALALFDLQRRFRFYSKLQLAAIGTIGRMQERGSKAQLAMIMYRNYGFAYPGAAIPRWVYSTLIGICAEAKAAPGTYEFLLEDMEKHHNNPDHRLYQQVLAACAHQGEVEAVFRVFAKFRQHCTITNFGDVRPLLNVFAVIGDSEGTQKQFDRLTSEFGLTPDVDSWALLLLSHARSLHNQTAFEIFDRMKQAGVKPDRVSWSVLINVAASRADTTKAQQLYETAKQEGLPESIHMLGPIVESHLRNDRTKEAETLVINTSRSSTIRSPVRLWNSLFRHYAFKSDSDAIHRLQKLMNVMKIAPDAMTYAALMTALVVRGQTSDALKVVRALHSSQQLNPTEFHYSILIHGFVQERNRNMATTIYHEMLEHFPRPSASARLATLHLRLQREEESIKERLHRRAESGEKESSEDFMPRQTLDLLAEMLMEDPRLDAASSVPSPGFRRQSNRIGLEAMFFGSLISFLQRNKAGRAAEELLEKTQAPSFKSTISPVVDIANLALKLDGAIENNRWAEADDTWQNILDTGRRAFSAINHNTSLNVTNRSSEALRKHQNTQFLGGEETFRSMLPPSIASSEAPYVLEAHKFALSHPLSLYLQALDTQCRHHDAVLLVSKMQAAGFSLSGRNWNRYIQILSKSADVDHRILAFKMFQTHLLPNAPHWNLIRRGRWITPQSARLSLAKQSVSEDRFRLERVNPALLMPTYYTMIYLAMALMKAHRSMIAGRPLERNAIQDAAPETVELVRSVPYLADRIQGLLLRDRPVIGDIPPRPRDKTQPGDHVGIKERRSLFDQIPVSVLENVEELLTPADRVRDSLYEEHRPDPPINTSRKVASRYAQHVQRQEARYGTIVREPQYIEKFNRLEHPEETQKRVKSDEAALLKPLLDLAEQIMGELHWAPLTLAAQGRLESEAEVQRRIDLQTVQRLDMIEQLRQEHVNPPDTDKINWGEAFKISIPHNTDRAAKVVDRQPAITSLMTNKSAARNSSKYQSETGTSGASQAQAAKIDDGLSEDQQVEALPRQRKRLLRQASRARSSLTHISSNIDTSVLNKRISLQHEDRNRIMLVPVGLRPRGRWSINRALRRDKALAKEKEARLRPKLVKPQGSKELHSRTHHRNIEKEQDRSSRTDSFFYPFVQPHRAR